MLIRNIEQKYEVKDGFNLDKPKKFTVICKICGSNNVEVFCNIHEEIIFECADCSEKEATN